LRGEFPPLALQVHFENDTRFRDGETLSCTGTPAFAQNRPTCWIPSRGGPSEVVHLIASRRFLVSTQRRQFLLGVPAWTGALAASSDTVCSYSSSFVTFVLKKRANLARLQVESRCVLLDAQGRVIEEFFQFASCKSEDTYARENLFLNPNYDFSGVFSREHYVLFRAGAPQDPAKYAERGVVKQRFEDVLFRIRNARNARVLKSNAEIVQATLAGHDLIGRTEIRDGATGKRAILEYPIKTMNVNDGRVIYQVDTGPIAFPDFTRSAPRPVDILELAYVAFNAPSEAYFVLQRPTALRRDGQESCMVSHYSEIRRMTATNVLMSAEV
jgi:hypothetical protein